MTAAECAFKTKLISDAMWNAAKKAVDDTTHEIFLVSTETFCPVDTGDLKGSAEDTIVENTNSRYIRKISYGNSKVDYAYWVHEIPYNHYNPPNAQWKYLEVPLNMYSLKLQSNVNSAMEDALDG